MKRSFGLIVAYIFIATSVAGCAGGDLRMRVEDKGGMTVETLVNNWQSYNVYYLGNPGYPVSVLFDLKDDGKIIKVAPRWERVTSQSNASRMVGVIGSHGYGVNIPRLWKLVGPDDSVFGHVYTTATRLSTNMADANTMFVDY